MQNDTYSELAAGCLPMMLSGFSGMDENGQYLEELKKWDYRLNSEGRAAAMFQIWWSCFYSACWKDITNVPNQELPLQERTMQLLQANIPFDKVYWLDTTLKNKNTTGGVPTAKLIVDLPINSGFKKMVDSVKKLEKTTGAEWYKVKNTSVTHLAKLPAFSYDHLKIGGWGNTINAAKGDHGPSWRMIVQMGKEIEAYGVYPGGQSGNPGSKYYADFLQQWVEGKYNKLEFFPNSDKQNDSSVKYVWTFNGLKS